MKRASLEKLAGRKSKGLRSGKGEWILSRNSTCFKDST